MEKHFFTFDEIKKATGGEWMTPPGEGGVSSVKTDSREDCSGALFLALKGENFDGHDFLFQTSADALCVEKSYAKKNLLPENVPTICVKDTLKAYQDLAEFHRKRLKDLKVVAITGSSGKTSAKEITKHILEEHFGKEFVLATEANTNNQIGVPKNVLNLTEKHKACVLEMGSNHSGEIEPLSKIANPDAALITIIGKCHLEHFGDLDGVALEKSSIFMHLKEEGTAIIPDDCPQSKILESVAKPSKIMKFGESKNADVRAKYLGGNINGSSLDLILKESGERLNIKWKLSGKHQALNAAAATCAALALGADTEAIVKGLYRCELPGMRMKIATKSGITWINDAYNANPDSMAAALSWLSEFADYPKLILVLGDMLELGEMSEEAHLQILRFATEQFTEAKLVVVGKQMIQACAHPEFAEKDILNFDDAEKAASIVKKMARKGNTVFLKASRGVRLEKIEP